MKQQHNQSLKKQELMTQSHYNGREVTQEEMDQQDQQSSNNLTLLLKKARLKKKQNLRQKK
jgi:hypothetical protein